MNGIEKVNPVYPGWQNSPKKDEQQKKDRDESENNRQSQHKQTNTEDGRPHIDEFA